MRGIALLLLCAMTAGLLSGCRKASEETPSVPEEPLRLETLTVEISKNGRTPEELLAAVRQLPEALAAGFAGTDVEVGEITVTVGPSPAATAQALAEGTVDLAFLPADDFLLHGGEARPLLGDAEEDGTPGIRSLVCTAPSAYGVQLSGWAEGEPITWAELDRARWGVLAADSLGGYRGLELWLSDGYGGDTVSDLSDVTVYGSYEELLRAAAREEIDAFSIRDDARTEAAEAWLLESSRTDSRGVHGFDRAAPVTEETHVLAVTEPLYTTLAAVGREDLARGAFPEALRQALAALDTDLLADLGAAVFAPVTETDLAPQRRLLTLEGR